MSSRFASQRRGDPREAIHSVTPLPTRADYTTSIEGQDIISTLDIDAFADRVGDLQAAIRGDARVPAAVADRLCGSLGGVLGALRVALEQTEARREMVRRAGIRSEIDRIFGTG